MLDYLDKLKSKPLYVRQQIAVVTTSLLSLLIFSVWWGGWTAEQKTIAELAVNEKSPTEVVGGIFANLKNGALEKWDAATGQILYVAQNADLIAGVGASEGTTTSTNVPVKAEDTSIR